MKSGSNEMIGHQKTQRGVTLLELLVVIALVSLLVAVVFPSVGAGLRTLELRSSAQRVAVAARFARDQAIHRQRFFQLEIDSQKKTVSVLDVAEGQRRSFELPTSVHVEKILPEEQGRLSTTRQFVFSPDGAVPQFQVVLGNQSRQVTVAADALTGFPKVSGL
ncbi:MAG: GspH/FimT family pseudopilin [Acidobacteria bacterium]|nr:GspH/FimT family pseudopilin [Acidobacteriota bacterium]